MPVSYVLQPISTHLPDFVDKQTKDKSKAASNAWWETSDHMSQLLATAATQALTADQAHKYLMSGWWSFHAYCLYSKISVTRTTNIKAN